MAHSGGDEIGSVYELPAAFEMEKIKGGTVSQYLRAGNKLVEVSYPIQAGDLVLGSVRMGLNTKWLRAETSQVHRTILIFLGTALAIVFLGIFLSTVIAKRISDPILQMKEAVEDIGRGEYDTKVDIKSNDEIGVLANAFNNMARELKDSRAQLVEKEALHESEKRYHALFDRSPDGIVLVNYEGKIIEFNESAHHSLGYTKEEFGKLSIADLDPFESPAAVKARIEKIMQSGRAEFDVKLRAKQGELREVHVISQIIMLSGIPFLHSIWHDITEIKKIQGSLEDKTAEQNAILENTLAGIAFLKDWRFIWINSKMEEIFGYQRNEVSGLTTEVFYPSKESYEELVKEAYPLRAGGQTYSAERLMKRKDGSVFWCSLSGKAIDPSALGKGSIWVSQDITARKEAEEKIRRSEQFVRMILDTVDEGFIVVDRDFRIMTTNKSYCKQVGRLNEDIIGRHCYEVSHWLDRPCYEKGEECAVRNVFVTGEPHSAIHHHKDPKGNILYVDTKAYPIGDKSGNVTSAIETITNITERYLLEEERLKTQKLESIGTLAGGIAHDFNNLLQGIFGYVSLAKISLDRPDRIKAMLQQAEEALHLSVNLTTQLLTFSKGGKPVKKLIRLELVIESAVKFALSGSHTDYKMDVAADLWPVEADEGQLTQVIQNIVLNANEAMAERGTVLVSLKNATILKETIPGLPAGGRFVSLSIQDSGTGISRQNLAKIFDPYFTTKQKGSGLGLATSYSIIRNHGGIIEVQSEVDKGSTFTIYLPAAEGTAMAPETVALISRAARKGKILVMDDEEIVRNVAEEMIKALGHEVQCAVEGKMAIEMVRQAKESGNPFDVVILDLTVKGGMGGEDAVGKLAEIDPGVVAVVSSGYSDNTVVANFREHGFSAFLNKPYKIDALRDCINKLL